MWKKTHTHNIYIKTDAQQPAAKLAEMEAERKNEMKKKKEISKIVKFKSSKIYWGHYETIIMNRHFADESISPYRRTIG